MTVSDSALKLFCSDLQAYAKVNLQIPIKGDEFRPPQMVPFEFNRSQKLVHGVLKEQWKRTKRIRAIILKSRQQGMSTYTSARFFRKLHLWPNHNAVVVADKDARSQVLFSMYDTYAHWLPEEMKPMMRWVSKKQEMFFDNPKDALRSQHPGLASGISVETAGDVDAGRSKTIHLAHLTEVSTWPNAFEVFNSLINAVPDFGSEVVVESTARGVGNFFHRMWEMAATGEGVTEGENGFIAIFIPWWIHEEYRLKKMTKKDRSEFRATCNEYEEKCLTEGFEYRGETHKLVEEQLAWRRWTIAEKSQHDERQFQQEYPATPEEAFLASGSNFFGEDYLKKYLLTTKAPERREVIEIRNPNGSGITTIKVGQGRLRVWEMPRRADWDKDDPGGRYVVGADTAEGRAVAAMPSSFDDPDREKGGRDFCSADVVDVYTRKLVASLHARMAPEEFAKQLNMLGRFYSAEMRTGLRQPALLAPERNHSSGATVVKYLKDRYNYPNLFRHQQIAQRMDRAGEKYGFITSVETRRPMLDHLAAHVHEREENDWLPSREHLKEFLTFVLGDDGKPQAQEGAHDDRVISLAITLFVLEIHAWHVPKNDDVTDLVEIGTSPTGWSTY